MKNKRPSKRLKSTGRNEFQTIRNRKLTKPDYARLCDAIQKSNSDSQKKMMLQKMLNGLPYMTQYTNMPYVQFNYKNQHKWLPTYEDETDFKDLPKANLSLKPVVWPLKHRFTIDTRTPKIVVTHSGLRMNEFVESVVACLPLVSMDHVHEDFEATSTIA